MCIRDRRQGQPDDQTADQAHAEAAALRMQAGGAAGSGSGKLLDQGSALRVFAFHDLGRAHAQHRQGIAQHLTRGAQQRHARARQRGVGPQEALGRVVTVQGRGQIAAIEGCLLKPSHAADEKKSVKFGGCRIAEQKQ